MIKQNYQGLSSQQVIENQKKYGKNILTQKEKTSVYKLFFEKFSDPIIIILLIALTFSFIVSLYDFFTTAHNNYHIFLEPVGILVAILLATGIAFYFEQKANNQFEILNKVNDEILYKVIRNQNVTQILKKEITLDDIVILETGEEIPADGFLLESVSLQVNESSLTGEPIVSKSVEGNLYKKETTYPENQIFRGTTITNGHCIFKVTQIGDQTEYGKIFNGIQIDNSTQTPLNQQLNKLAHQITKISYLLAFLVISSQIILYFNYLEDNFNWLHFSKHLLSSFMIAITIIVVAVPEGLPMSVTLSLAYSMRSMLKNNNLVRKIHACETIGATTVICTDKTGTLTQNQMQINSVYFNDFQEFTHKKIPQIIAESLGVNATAFLDFSQKTPKVLGNPTEGALLLWLHQQNLNYQILRKNTEIISQIAFSTERKYMATWVKSHTLNKTILYVKGAPEIVMNFCKNEQNILNSTISEEKFQQKLNEFQKQAMRTIGFAYKIIEENQTAINENEIVTNQLNFIGIVAISDPIRSDVPQAISDCLQAGIQVKIITGDTSETAKEIARQIGIWDTNCNDKNHISGTELQQISDTELLQKLPYLRVISRAKPMDKARLVTLLQQQGEIVAVTGDGTNDAPALKTAQVGLSMGDGTSVAKEASDITILDNSFASIGKSVMWGRSLYLNIQRFILFQLTINVSACIIVLLGSFLGVQSPLTVTQMLWVNLIMDTFAALALASLPPSKSVMKNKPRNPKKNIITPKMTKSILGVGLFFVVFLFGLIQYFRNFEITKITDFSLLNYFKSFAHFSSEKNSISLYELSLFFSIFVFLQFWNMFNAKAYQTKRSAFYNLKNNRGFLFIAGIILIGQIGITSFFGNIFGIAPLYFIDWIVIISATSIILFIGEINRFFAR